MENSYPAQRVHAFLKVATPVKQARQALGARLREVRVEANLTGRALAAVCEWHFTKISKLEHGAQAPSEQDIRAWCRACGAENEIPDLIATVRAIESMYVEWQRHMRAGLKRSQTSSVPLYERTKLFRGYENTVIPGLFHTAEYAAAIFRFWNEFLDLPGNVDEAVAARMERQRVLYTGARRFAFVLEEQTLRTRVGDTDVMLGQLDRVLAVMSLPRVRSYNEITNHFRTNPCWRGVSSLLKRVVDLAWRCARRRGCFSGDGIQVGGSAAPVE